MEDRTRRRVIRIYGSALPVALAGCSNPFGGGGEEGEGGGEEGGEGEEGEEGGDDVERQLGNPPEFTV